MRLRGYASFIADIHSNPCSWHDITPERVSHSRSGHCHIGHPVNIWRRNSHLSNASRIHYANIRLLVASKRSTRSNLIHLIAHPYDVVVLHQIPQSLIHMARSSRHMLPGLTRHSYPSRIVHRSVLNHIRQLMH